MKALRGILLVVLLSSPDATLMAQADPITGCIDCHGDPALTLDERLRAPVPLFQDDVHQGLGLGCHDCHGGDPSVGTGAVDAADLAHAESAGFRGVPDTTEIPAFCGRCHSDAGYMGRYAPGGRVDQEVQYAASVHGQRLAEGDDRVAQCLSCHGRPADEGDAQPRAHGILPVSDARAPVYPTHVASTCGRCHADAELMRPYRIPTDQLALYEGSVHHRQLTVVEDLSAPTCNDCHGNHGARPPNVESLAFVCGSCHVRQAELFRASAMHEAFAMMELGECAVCHGTHGVAAPSDGMLVDASPPAQDGVLSCSECHDAADDPARPASESMHAAITGLAGELTAAEATVREAAEKGMPVMQADYVLATARDALIDSRVLIHGWDTEPVLEGTDRGLEAARKAGQLGTDAIADYFFRHRWLGLSLVGIGLVIVTLVLKIRQVDRRWRASHDEG
jgi:hypothetical protein